ncbi:MAG TPA: hypothetical protein VF055_11745, partial [Steroidobacteraceae bacterium]
KIAFRDLPDRFPSVLSRDFRREQGQYEDPDNLYAMYLLYNLGRYSVRIDEPAKRLQIALTRSPLPYARATTLAEEAARSDSVRYAQRAAFTPQGTRVSDAEPEPPVRP